MRRIAAKLVRIVSSASITNMNRSRPPDSKLSLDAGIPMRDSARMIAQPYHLYVERIEPEKNMARFYLLAVQPTLFGEVSLVRNWGRIGTRGQEKIQLFDYEMEAVEIFLDLARKKKRKGYRPRPRR